VKQCDDCIRLELDLNEYNRGYSAVNTTDCYAVILFSVII